MRFVDNEVILSRRERKALVAPSRRVSALAIGSLWRVAMVEISENRERLGTVVSDVSIVPGLGAVSSHSAEYYELKRLDKQQKCLDGIGHMAVAIEDETIPPGQAL